MNIRTRWRLCLVLRMSLSKALLDVPGVVRRVARSSSRVSCKPRNLPGHYFSRTGGLTLTFQLRPRSAEWTLPPLVSSSLFGSEGPFILAEEKEWVAQDRVSGIDILIVPEPTVPLSQQACGPCSPDSLQCGSDCSRCSMAGPMWQGRHCQTLCQPRGRLSLATAGYCWSPPASAGCHVATGQ